MHRDFNVTSRCEQPRSRTGKTSRTAPEPSGGRHHRGPPGGQEHPRGARRFRLGGAGRAIRPRGRGRPGAGGRSATGPAAPSGPGRARRDSARAAALPCPAGAGGPAGRARQVPHPCQRFPRAASAVVGNPRRAHRLPRAGRVRPRRDRPRDAGAALAARRIPALVPGAGGRGRASSGAGSSSAPSWSATCPSSAST